MNQLHTYTMGLIAGLAGANIPTRSKDNPSSAPRYLSDRAIAKRDAREKAKEAIRCEVSLTGWQTHQWERGRNKVMDYNKNKPASKRKPLPKREEFATLTK